MLVNLSQIIVTMSFLEECVRSLMRIKNNRVPGPRIEPCGTPFVIQKKLRNYYYKLHIEIY